MFHAFYKFRYINNSTKNVKGQFVKEHKLTFCCEKGHQYIVNVEQYNFDLFAIKFYLKSHRFSENKYKLLTGHKNPTRVIRTCVEIIRYFLRENPFASFGFIGENSIAENTQSNTKRFRVYRRVMENFFSPLVFWHFVDDEKSLYLLLNRQKNESDIVEKIEGIIDDILSD